MITASLEDSLDVGDVFFARGNIYDSLNALRNVGISAPISPRDAALVLLSDEARFDKDKTQKRSILYRNGFATCMGVLSYAGRQFILADSPLNDLEMAKKAVETNSQCRYLEIENRDLYDLCMQRIQDEKSLSPEQRTVMPLPQESDLFFVSEQAHLNIARFLFKDLTSEFFNFVRKKLPHSQMFIPVYHRDSLLDLNDNVHLAQLEILKLPYHRFNIHANYVNMHTGQSAGFIPKTKLE